MLQFKRYSPLIVTFTLALLCACPAQPSLQLNPGQTTEIPLQNTPEPVRTAQPDGSEAVPERNTPSKLSLTPVVTDLDTPWELLFLPDGRMLISERPGRIIAVKDGEKSLWLDLAQLPDGDAVVEQGEGGLMGLTQDPNSASPRLYAAYNYRSGRSRFLRVVRLVEVNGQGQLDRIILDQIPAASNHNGGRLRFGPDGQLYWSVGELFQQDLAQSLDSPNGKILRMDTEGGIPPGNPFMDSFIYSYGHRNPQGLAWDNQGRLFSTEHGPSGEKGCCQDELNWIQPGKNYGWPQISGDETKENMENPVLHSGNNTTWAPGGLAFLTQGPWAGSLLFTGLRGESLYRVQLDPNTPEKILTFETHLSGQLGRLRQVVEGPDGFIYLLTSNQDGRGNPRKGDDQVIQLKVE